MYKPHLAQISFHQVGFDENRNPIQTCVVESRPYECYFDNSMPNIPTYTSDGQLIPDMSGIIYFQRDFLYMQNTSLEIGAEIKVFRKGSTEPFFIGKIKSWSEDLFHTRVWV